METIKERVLAGLKTFGPCTRNELAEKTGLGPGQVSPVLTILSQAGKARSNEGIWSYIEKGATPKPSVPAAAPPRAAPKPSVPAAAPPRAAPKPAPKPSVPAAAPPRAESRPSSARPIQAENPLKTPENRVSELEQERDELRKKVTDLEREGADLRSKTAELQKLVTELELERDALVLAATEEGDSSVEEALEDVREMKVKANRWSMFSSLARQLFED